MKNLMLILFVGVVAFGCSKSEQNNDNIHPKVDSLNLVIKSLIQEKDSVKSLLNLEKDYWFNQKYHGENFKVNGIKNPKEFLWNSLDSKRELIPMEAILGGTIQYGKLEILSSKWLIVEYTDGHIMGKALFEYDFNENNVNFKLIGAIKNE